MFIGYLVFAPILIAPVLYRIGRKNEEARDLLAILFAFVELLVSISLFMMQGAKLFCSRVNTSDMSARGCQGTGCSPC